MDLQTAFSAKKAAFAGLFIAFSYGTSLPLKAQSIPEVELKPVISGGLSNPVQVVSANDGTQRLFIVQQGGTIKVFDKTGDDQYTDRGTFFEISGIPTSGEQGLLSLAFHPDFTENRTFYVYYTNAGGNLQVSAYQTGEDPNRFDPDSYREVIIIAHPTNSNHNGGEMHFGPDGFLYLSTGDGGGGGDVPGNAQNLEQNLGKILRIDPEAANIIPQSNPYPNSPVFAYGLRNPFRWSFDRSTGDVWIGDVGQSSFEEINSIPFSELREANFGWRCYEGDSVFNFNGCSETGAYIFPIHTYPIGSAGRSVVGGVVYRGTAFPDLRGYYIGADHYNNRLHLISRTAGGGFAFNNERVGVGGIADFGEDENGEVYAVGRNTSTLYRVITSDTSSLPVQFVYFGVKKGEGLAARVEWETVNSELFGAFDIQKSTDGAGFTNIATIPRKDLQGEAAKYVFEDRDVISQQKYYYRIRVLNDDGTVEYSPIKTFYMPAGEGETADDLRYIRPNVITDGVLKLEVSDPFEKVELVSLSGYTAGKFSLDMQTGPILLNTGSLPAGLYLARFTGPEKVVVEKVIFK